MQPFLAVASLVAALAVAVNSETAYILAPVQHQHQPHHNIHHAVNPRILTTGWGWRPVKTVSIALPTITRGWGWKPKPKGVSIGVYGGIRIGPKQQGWGKQPSGWGWQPPKQQGWGWQPPKQQGWGWEPPKQQGWGWKQQGWGWGGDDDDDDEDDYRSSAVAPILYDDIPEASSEEILDDEDSAESEEADSAEADSPYHSLAYSPYDLRNSIAYEPVY